ncbi:MAG: leucyl/phenylalanyl-tRNA--protein transferase [Proteobacteria bacterium]|nr:leucyl/phenylalanyl-tRNA--protein transferase [Pseudomonadota bacterium]
MYDGGMLHPELLLQAYASGLFPMAESAESEDVFWVDPPKRAIFPLESFHVPHRLARSLRKGVYGISVNRCFPEVIAACAAVHRREKTWINKTIRQSYIELHKHGFTHSVEAWKDNKLVGGLYGVSLAGAFFGESMFSTARDASKMALVHLVARLVRQKYRLLDTQFVNPHLVQFGVKEITRAEYHSSLGAALEGEAFFGEDEGFEGERSLVSGFLQSRTQTS